MRDIEINLPLRMIGTAIERIFEEAARQRCLIVTRRSSLKKFPGCVHWHLKKGGERGTLELTFWPAPHRAWFTVQAGRVGGWIDEEIKLLGEHLQTKFAML